MQSAEANLVAGMKWLQNTYTHAFNLRPRLWGGCSENPGSKRIDAPGLEGGNFANLKGGEARKVAIARMTRQRTIVSMSWIAAHLSIRSAAAASQQIRRQPKVAKGVPKGLKPMGDSVMICCLTPIFLTPIFPVSWNPPHCFLIRSNSRYRSRARRLERATDARSVAISV